MPEDYSNNTITFSLEEVREADMKKILLTVYDAPVSYTHLTLPTIRLV